MVKPSVVFVLVALLFSGTAIAQDRHFGLGIIWKRPTTITLKK